jgi:hypothetical protein
MEPGIRLSFVKTSEFGGVCVCVQTPPPPRHWPQVTDIDL